MRGFVAIPADSCQQLQAARSDLKQGVNEDCRVSVLHLREVLSIDMQLVHPLVNGLVVLLQHGFQAAIAQSVDVSEELLVILRSVIAAEVGQACPLGGRGLNGPTLRTVDSHNVQLKATSPT